MESFQPSESGRGWGVVGRAEAGRQGQGCLDRDIKKVRTAVLAPSRCSNTNSDFSYCDYHYGFLFLLLLTLGSN